MVWKEDVDEEAYQRVKHVFVLYAQLVVEMKLHEGHSPDLSRSALLPLVEMASALILSRYKVPSLPDIVMKLESLNNYQYFDYLWEDVLGMNPLVLGVFTNKVVSSSYADPVLMSKESYFNNKHLRTLLLSSHPLKFKFTSLPPDFASFKALNC